jgi:hypothetical protein
MLKNFKPKPAKITGPRIVRIDPPNPKNIVYSTK